jgi:hypothetical protein
MRLTTWWGWEMQISGSGVSRKKHHVEKNRILTRSNLRKLSVIFVATLALGACAGSSTSSTTPFQGLDGCQVGAGSAMAFLQRTLDALGDAEIEEASDMVPTFDHDVETMALRAREVHCTEEGFNQAIVERVGELKGDGPAAQMLIATVETRGLGSLDAENGGLITLSGE